MARATERGAVEELPWRQSYEQASVDRFLAAAAAEESRLTEELAAARARIDAARIAIDQVEARARGALAEMVLATQAEIELLEQDHASEIERIRTTAGAEASRILDAARTASAAPAQSDSDSGSSDDVR